MIQQPPKYWSIPQSDLLTQLNAKKEGLSSEEAKERLAQYGANLLKPAKRSDTLALLIAQFKSPIILTLIFAAGLSAFLHDPVDAIIIIAIVLISGLLGFWQEKGAANALEKMLAIVKIKTTVLRDGTEHDIALEDVVPGDIVILNAGDAIPADSLILESTDLFMDEATLTGESRHTSSAYLTFVSLDQLGKPMEIPQVIPKTEDEIRRNKEAAIRRNKRMEGLRR